VKLVPIDLQTTVSTTDNQVIIRRKPQRIKRSRPFIRPLDKNLIEGPRDLDAIWKAYNAEAYLHLAVNKHVSLGVKGGWDIIGTNTQAVNYIKRRLLEIFTQTNISTNHLMRMVMRDLVLYGNAFLVKVRDIEASSGNPIRKDGKTLEPIAAYFPQNPRTMKAKKNAQGKLVAWQQGDPEDDQNDAIEEAIRKALSSAKLVKEKEFTIYPVTDVVHFHYNREGGFIFGQPIWLPALQDIISLRRMEEDAEQVVRRNAFPLVHYRIGTETYPAEQTEINDRANELNELEPGEIIVSDFREEIDVASTSGGVDATPYLSYFEERVFAGLNLSPVEVGRGGTVNKSTATQIARQRIEQVKDFQRVVEDFFLHFMIYELLSEANSVKLQTLDKEEIRLKFKEIDHETQIELENHAADLYTKNIIPFEEARDRMDLNGDIDDKDLYMERVTIPTAKAEAALKPAPGDNVNRSQNQHGKKLSTKGTQNDQLAIPEYSDHETPDPPPLTSKNFPDLDKLEDRLTADLDQHVEEIKQNFLLNPKWTSATILYPLMKLGYVEHVLPYLELFGSEEVTVTVIDRLFKHVDKIWDIGGKKLRNKEATEEELLEAFDFIKGRNRSVARFNLRKTMNMMIARESVCESKKITSKASTCEERHGEFLTSARFSAVPPWHRNCKCVAEPLKDGAHMKQPVADLIISVRDMINEWASDIGITQPSRVDDINTGVSLLKGMLEELNNG
tara:strand:- start:2609 stop:4801 length:2193 start_codon:yes stop_codon:yes gene_type:complete